MIGADPVPETLSAKAGHLFEAYRSQEPEAMADLVALVSPILWHTARAARLDQATAEDVVQTTWLALLRHAPSISSPAAVLQWLVVTARREAWRVSRVQSRVKPEEFTGEEIATPEKDGPEMIVVRNAGDDVLWRHLSALPERCQQLLRVIAFSDRPDYNQLATALGMPVGSIGPTRGRCLAKLRAQLAADSDWEYA
ncbi:RNA polymerase sigma factor (sigma-70 family) [Jatrophihabitans sp. GAS493]|uniref:RNA polymerase sigma factor n=1 Tax=Jatrophihabitans sp. GAS493 TaxID=1907575 RepID=UPI000BB6C131|nr:sigma-70 family RNA polymerase sigma factor [Jatrophihabitans sp. GAS493]SOD72363.1 RNA polymerase sigma factor (sigma-70 family) [Jatrophihabitans sp. GAS493]